MVNICKYENVSSWPTFSKYSTPSALFFFAHLAQAAQADASGYGYDAQAGYAGGYNASAMGYPAGYDASAAGYTGYGGAAYPAGWADIGLNKSWVASGVQKNVAGFDYQRVNPPMVNNLQS